MIELEDDTSTTRDGGTIEVLIDGDIIAYRASAPCDGAHYIVDGTRYKYHKDAVKALGDKAGTLTVHYDPEPEEYALNNVNTQIKSILEDVGEEYGCSEVLVSVFITGKENFRNAVSSSYKKSRKGTRKPKHLDACKQHLLTAWDAHWVSGYEADDLLHITAKAHDYEDVVIASIDKDLLQIPTKHYNFVKKEFCYISEEEGRHRFWTQVLTGDATDDIEGLHRVGPVKAEKILESCRDHDDLTYYKKVVEAYLKHVKMEEDEFESDYYERIIKRITKTARLLYLVGEYDELWEPPTKSDPAIAKKRKMKAKMEIEDFHKLMVNAAKEIKTRPDPVYTFKEGSHTHTAVISDFKLDAAAKEASVKLKKAIDAKVLEKIKGGMI